MKINRYKITLLFNAFPSYSISSWFLTTFIQPRLFSFPFLISENFKFRKDKWNLLLLINLIISLLIPFLGVFFERQVSLLDIAYILSSIYTFYFINVTIKKTRNIAIFNSFLYLILILNFFYVLLQLIFYFLGFPEYTMLHSNMPFQVNINYTIPTGLILRIPRYTGLFNESGPFTFFLCLTFVYLIQSRKRFPTYLKVIVIILIIFSQSKFLLVFIPFLIVETIFKFIFPRLYKFSLRPLFFFTVIVSLIFLVLIIIFGDSELGDYFAKTIPAYNSRMNGIRLSFSSLLDIGLFGRGLVSSTGATSEISSLDAFSIVFSGYGLFMGTIMILTIIMFPVLANMKYKYTYFAILFMGFLSNGSLLIPQYLFAIVFIILIHYQNTTNIYH